MIGSQDTPKERPECDQWAPSTFRVSDVSSERAEACPEVTHLALEVDWLSHTSAQVGRSRKALVFHS